STAPRINSPAGPGELLQGTEVRCLWTAGFIANRRALELLSAGDDGALLERLYNHSAAAAPRQVAGPFSWILSAGRRQELVAAVDWMGHHGLYFATDGARLLLATRLDLLLAAARREPRFNLRSLAAHIGWTTLRPGETFYEGIEALEPGGLLRASCQGL